MIRIGILGAAKIAPKAIIKPAQNREDCKVIAVASRSLERAQNYAKQYDIPVSLSGYEPLIEREDIDLIYNALPPHRHMDLSFAALKAGKSVLCEKPFALNATEAEDMVNMAKVSKGYLIEAFHYRYHPATLKFLDILKEGTIGDIRKIEGIFNVSIPNREGELRYIPELGGGALMDLGCYVIHLMRLITKKEPDIKSAVSTVSQTGVDVRMEADMHFDDISASLTCDMNEGTERIIKFTVIGDKGRIIFEQFVHPYRDPGFSIKVETDSGLNLISQNDNKALYTKSTYAYQLDHVIDVMSEKTSPLTGGLDAIQTMKAIDAIYAASRA